MRNSTLARAMLLIAISSAAHGDKGHHSHKKPPAEAPPPDAAPATTPTATPATTPTAAATAEATAAPTGAAAGTEEDARRLFMAGRQAYQDGRFDVASTSFEAAYRIKPVPALLFNLAQAYRKQYLVNQDAETLRRAVDDYRRYMEGAPTGPNREAALQALTDLTPILARVAPDSIGGKNGSRPLTVARTEVMIVTEAAEAKVSLDGAAPVAAPLLAQVAVGEHKATVDAPGFFPAEVKVTAVDGRLVTAEARLQPRPGRIDVQGDSSARVAVDGRVVGRLPLAAPVEVPAGKHTLAVMERGHEAYASELTVGNGATAAVKVSLPTTTQRRAVRWVGVVTILAALATVGTAAVWYQADTAAADLNAKRVSGTITPAQLGEYYDDRTRRDDWRSGTYAAAGVTALLAIVTGSLYLFDNPEAPRPMTSGITTSGGTAAFSF